MTNEQGELAIVTSKGLFILHYHHESEVLQFKQHSLRSMDLLSCAYVKEKELLLAKDGESVLFVYDFRY